MTKSKSGWAEIGRALEAAGLKAGPSKRATPVRVVTGEQIAEEAREWVASLGKRLGSQEGAALLVVLINKGGARKTGVAASPNELAQAAGLTVRKAEEAEALLIDLGVVTKTITSPTSAPLWRVVSSRLKG